jgi:phage-related protein
MTLTAIIDDIYTTPVEDGMPPSSKLGRGVTQTRDGYVVTMYAPAFDVFSHVEMTHGDVKKTQTNPSAMVSLLERRLNQLRQLHHFACLSKRGGYY